MKYKKLLFTVSLLSSFFISASEDIKSTILEGSYSLVKGDDEKCPAGEVIYSKKSERLILGTRISFDLEKLGELRTERVPSGCRYEELISFKEGTLNKVIEMSKCPVRSENGIIVQKLSLKNNKLYYTSVKKGDLAVSCLYSKEAGQ